MSQHLTDNAEDAKQHLISLLALMKIDKVFFVDDSLFQEPELAVLKGLIRSIKAIDKLEEIKKQLSFIPFSDDIDILIENIEAEWDEMKPISKIKCFEVAYKVLNQKEEYTNINVSSVLNSYFEEDILILCSPSEWANYFQSHTKDSKNILVLFDQNLSKAGNEYTVTKGQDLIFEIKNNGFRSNIFPALFTFTIQEVNQEIEERNRIIDDFTKNDKLISSEDFFVFTKDRLNKPNLLADAIKKLFLNEFSERVKNQTYKLTQNAFNKTINELNALDTYSFEVAVLKSSFKEGIWEAETLLRMTNIYFEDFLKEEMIDSDYLLNINEDLTKAHSISNCFDIVLDEVQNSPYLKPKKLRAKEIYESGEIINKLHKPIENGDIFELKFENGEVNNFILIGQECDLMIRNVGTKEGNRSAKSAILIKINDIPDPKKFKLKNDNYILEYFTKENLNSVSVNFTELLHIDMNVLDLSMFNENGCSNLDFSTLNNREKYFSSTVRKRYGVIINDLKHSLKNTFELLDKLAVNVTTEDGKNIIKQLSPKAIIIGDLQIEKVVDRNKINFEIQRVKRLRNPYARLVLEKYMRHLARSAEQHDFAKKK
jgi:hypothetical protein